MNKIRSTHTVFPIDKARRIVDGFNSDLEEDWKYQIIPNPKEATPTTAIIAIYDEENEFIGYL